MPKVIDNDPEYVAQKAQLAQVQQMQPTQRQAFGVGLSGQVGETPGMAANTLNARSQMMTGSRQPMRTQAEPVYMQGSQHVAPPADRLGPVQPNYNVPIYMGPDGRVQPALTPLDPNRPDVTRGGLPAVPGAYQGAAAGRSSGQYAGPRTERGGRVARAPEQVRSGVQFPKYVPPVRNPNAQGRTTFPANVPQAEAVQSGTQFQGMKPIGVPATEQAKWHDWHIQQGHVKSGQYWVLPDEIPGSNGAHHFAPLGPGEKEYWDNRRQYEVNKEVDTWKPDSAPASFPQGQDAAASTVPQRPQPQYGQPQQITPEERAARMQQALPPSMRTQQADAAEWANDPDTNALIRQPAGAGPRLSRYEQQQKYREERDAVEDERWERKYTHALEREGILDTRHATARDEVKAWREWNKQFGEGKQKSLEAFRADNAKRSEKVHEDLEKERGRSQKRYEDTQAGITKRYEQTRSDVQQRFDSSMKLQKERMRISTAQWAMRNGIAVDPESQKEMDKIENDHFVALQDVDGLTDIIRGLETKMNDPGEGIKGATLAKYKESVAALRLQRSEKLAEVAALESQITQGKLRIAHKLGLDPSIVDDDPDDQQAVDPDAQPDDSGIEPMGMNVQEPAGPDESDIEPMGMDVSGDDDSIDVEPLLPHAVEVAKEFGADVGANEMRELLESDWGQEWLRKAMSEP